MPETIMTTPEDAPQDIARGTLLEVEDDRIVLGLEGTDYRLYLQVSGRINASPNTRIKGRITARACRVDRIRRGGRFIEPVYGRPRRVQGTIIGADPSNKTITVRCGGQCPMVCELTAKQEVADFPAGSLVGFDVERGTQFEPIG